MGRGGTSSFLSLFLGGSGMSAGGRQGTHTAPSTAKYRKWYARGHLVHMCSFQETWGAFFLFFSCDLYR